MSNSPQLPIRDHRESSNTQDLSATPTDNTAVSEDAERIPSNSYMQYTLTPVIFAKHLNFHVVHSAHRNHISGSRTSARHNRHQEAYNEVYYPSFHAFYKICKVVEQGRLLHQSVSSLMLLVCNYQAYMKPHFVSKREDMTKMFGRLIDVTDDRF